MLLAETREEMLKADHKAGVLLVVLTTAMVTVLGVLGVGGTPPHEWRAVSQILFWAGCGEWLASVILAGSALLPRTGSPHLRRAHYFGDVTLHGSFRLLNAAVRDTDVQDRLVGQFAVLSHLVLLKYRRIRWAMFWSMAFILCTGMGLLMGLPA